MNDWLRFYFSFKGRATRYDFNVRYALVALVGMIAAAFLDFVVVNGMTISPEMRDPFSNFWNLVIIVPTFAVTCRRLHDMNYSGWWQVLVHMTFALCLGVLIFSFGVAFLLNPLIAGVAGLMGIGAVGLFYVLFFLALSMKRGTPGPNRYGDNPLEVIA